MSFETQPTPSKEALPEVFKAFSAQIEASQIEISDLRASIWSSDRLTQDEKIQLLTQLVESEVLLARRDDYVQKAA